MATYSKEAYDKTFKKPVRMYKGEKIRKRCLGPRKTEHYFMSLGPYNRLCFDCQRAVDLLSRGIPKLYMIAVGKEHYHE